MLARVAVLVLAALAAVPSSLADNHLRSKRDRRSRHADVAERQVEERSSGNHTLVKRFTGRGTFYYTGLGACGTWSKDSDYLVALNSAQYGGGYPGPQCFKTITISSNGVTVPGVTILDECPTCNYGDLDLSPSLFDRFHSANGGTLELTWWFEDGSSNPPPAPSTHQEPTSTWQPPPPPPSSTSTWVEPTSTWVPPTSTSTWVAPTSTTPTSTWVAPSSTSTAASSSSSASSAWSSAAASSASASSVTASASASSVNPFAIVSNHPSSTQSADPAQSTGPTVVRADVDGNLAAMNGLVATYGQLIVQGAGGGRK